MGTELIDFLKPHRTTTKLQHDNMGLMDQAPYSFHHLMGEPSSNNIPSSSAPGKFEEPQLFIRVKEENENLRQKVD